MQTTSIKKGAGNYGEWKNTLSFYKDELGIFKNALLKLCKKIQVKKLCSWWSILKTSF